MPHSSTRNRSHRIQSQIETHCGCIQKWGENRFQSFFLFLILWKLFFFTLNLWNYTQNTIFSAHFFHPIQYYKVPVYEESSDKFLSENQLTEQLLLILKDSGHNEQVGILTTEHRDTLAVAYENLTQGTDLFMIAIQFSFCQTISLKIINKIIFLFCFIYRCCEQSFSGCNYKITICRLLGSTDSGVRSKWRFQFGWLSVDPWRWFETKFRQSLVQQNFATYRQSQWNERHQLWTFPGRRWVLVWQRRKRELNNFNVLISIQQANRLLYWLTSFSSNCKYSTNKFSNKKDRISFHLFIRIISIWVQTLWLAQCTKLHIFLLLCNRKTEPSENEIINAHSFPHPTKLPFNISEKTQKDIQIAAENIDKYVFTQSDLAVHWAPSIGKY